MPNLEYLTAGRITVNRNLVQGDHVFVFVDNMIQIGKGESPHTSRFILFINKTS